MAPQTTFRLKETVDELKYEILYASSDYETLQVRSANIHRPGMQFMGYYGYFDKDRIQLIGMMEAEFMATLPREERLRRYDEFFSHKMPAVVVCHGQQIFPDIEESARKYDVTVLFSEHETGFVSSELTRVLYLGLSPRITRHGVLVEVYGLGLLILGDSGIGKSEAAIELLKRGHRLVADDAVEISAIDYNTLQGSAPDLIRHYVELRGIGIIDVRQIFGAGSVKEKQHLHLIVNLEPWKEGVLYDRLGLENQYMNILGINVPSVTIPVRPGRNLAVILEVAAMNARQKHMGFNAAQQFTEQINKHFDEQLAKQRQQQGK